MLMISFDFAGQVNRLKKAGVPDSQAEAHVEGLREALKEFGNQIVTRDYLDARLMALEARIDAGLTERFAEQNARYDKRFAEQDTRFDERIAEQNARYDERFAEHNARFAKLDLKMNTLTVMMAAVFAVSVLPALSRFFS